MSHDHEIRQLNEIDRRNFLKTSSVVSGLALLSNFFEVASATALNPASLPGFAAFSNSVKVFKDGKYYLVESNGIPAHQMMVGIITRLCLRAWFYECGCSHGINSKLVGSVSSSGCGVNCLWFCLTRHGNHLLL